MLPATKSKSDYLDTLATRKLVISADGQSLALLPPPGFVPLDYQRLESAMLAMPQSSWDSVHEFAPGMYLRRTSIPAGSLVLGKRHKKPSLNLLLSGQVILFGPDGTSVVLNAPKCFFGPAGAQKLAYTITDIVCANLFAVDSNTVEAVEAEVFE